MNPNRDRIPSQNGNSSAAPLFPSRFRFIKPTLPSLDDVMSIYRSAYEEGLITNANIVARFEAAAKERLEVKHAVAVSSCTSGLMLVLQALDLKGEIILPSFTFFATGHAAAWNRLRPVFADCDPKTWTMDVADVERRITENTSAILGVHLYGNPCNVEALSRLATKHRLKLVFDAAHAFGSRYQGRAIGQFGDAEVFSLSPTKLLVAGEGGIVSTNDSTLAQKIRVARNYGDSGDYDPQLTGLNARMSEFNAALALAGMDLLDQKIRRHNEIANRYARALAWLPGIRLQQVNTGDTNSYKDFSIHIDKEAFGMDRDQVGAALSAQNIDTKRYFYPPLHRQTLYRRYFDPARPLPRTDVISGGILSLPIYESLPDEIVDGVAFAVTNLAAQEDVVLAAKE